MSGLLIADKNAVRCKQMAEAFLDAGYQVTVTPSAAGAISQILKKTTNVVLLGSELRDASGVDLIPLLKLCNRELSIILVSDDVPLPQMRKARRAGIFYHALRPLEDEGLEEIRQAVRCAFGKKRDRVTNSNTEKRRTP